METAVVPANSNAEKPAATRMWVALQKLGRLRDQYTRDASAAGRLMTARAMVELADEVQQLVHRMVDDASVPPTGSSTGTAT